MAISLNGNRTNGSERDVGSLGSESSIKSHDLDQPYRSLAAGLLSQQIWCFGQDIEFSRGNLLTEVGFDRKPPPSQRQDNASLYSRDLGSGKRLILRGFGILISGKPLGTLFIARFGFLPLFSAETSLRREPWSSEDLPSLKRVPARLHPAGRLMLINLIDSLIDYETEIASLAGEGYRNETLKSWIDGDRWSVSGDEMMGMWRQLSLAISGCQWNPMLDDRSQDF